MYLEHHATIVGMKFPFDRSGLQSGRSDKALCPVSYSNSFKIQNEYMSKNNIDYKGTGFQL